MEHYILNQRQEKICIEVKFPKPQTASADLAFICHGISGYKEQDVILQTQKSLLSQNYVVVTFDCRNSRGKSFNNQTCAGITSFYEDLKTVIDWAKQQTFYVSPFLLAGHSLGGSVAIYYTQQNPQNIKSLILISSVFSGEELLSNTKLYSPEFMKSLENGGVIRANEGIKCFLDDTYLKDLMNYNLIKDTDKISVPTLMITGQNDTASTPDDNKRFFKKLSCNKELHILDNCSHVYETEENQEQLNRYITDFIIANK